MASLADFLDLMRDHLLELAYAAAGLLLFLIFLLASFPYADALTGVLSPLGLSITNSGQQFAFPIGVRLNRVRVIDGSADHPLLESDSMRVSPALMALLLGSPGVVVHADLYGGALKFRARKSGDGTTLMIDL